jgi:hypothetical protein
MPRMISFTMTTKQIRERTKTVTRRTGWSALQPHEKLWAVAKAQGLRMGEKVTGLGYIEVRDVRREPLHRIVAEPSYGIEEMKREGFPGLDPSMFLTAFCAHNRCKPTDVITRIEFSYLDSEP